MVSSDRKRLSELSFSAFCRLILDESGILFEESKRDRLEMALNQRTKAAGLRNYEEYYHLLTDTANGRSEMQELLNAVTIQETQFFRNPAQFDALAEKVLPRLIRDRKEKQAISIWSAGCATGEEPYSLAMTLLQQLPYGWNGLVVGTDISTKALASAEKGVYTLKAVAHLPELVRRRFFVTEGDKCRVSDEVRAAVAFSRQNLFEGAPPLHLIQGVDIIFCRNVLIYFSAEKRCEIVERFFRMLSPGGYLFLGHSESLWKINSQFKLDRWGEAFVYRKESRPARAPAKANGPKGRRNPSHGKRGDEPENRLRLVVPAKERTRRDEHTTAPVAVGPADARLESLENKSRLEGPGLEFIKPAKKAMETGDYGRALELLNRAVGEDCLSAAAHFLAGCVYQRQGDLDRAWKTFRKVLFLEPSYALAHLHLATISETRGDRAVAAREYRNAVKSAGEGMSVHCEDFLEGLSVESFMQLCAVRAEALSPPEAKTGGRR